MDGEDGNRRIIEGSEEERREMEEGMGGMVK